MFKKHIEEIKENAMEFSEMITLFEDVYGVIQDLRASGLLAKLQSDEQSVVAEAETDPKVQALYAAVEKLFFQGASKASGAPVPAPAAPAA
jgi:hypothetical protein